MNTADFLRNERNARDAALLKADPEARMARLEARVEELTRQVCALMAAQSFRQFVGPIGPNQVFYTRTAPPAPLTFTSTGRTLMLGTAVNDSDDNGAVDVTL